MNFINFYDQVSYGVSVFVCLIYAAGHIWATSVAECTVDGESIQFHDIRYLYSLYGIV